MNNRHRQQGVGFLGLVFILAVIAFLVLCGMKLFPLYNESFQVTSAMKTVAGMPDIGQQSGRDIQNYLMRNFEVNDLRRFNQRNIGQHFKVQRIAGSRNRMMTMEYEARGPLFGNLDIVLRYNNSIEIPGGSVD